MTVVSAPAPLRDQIACVAREVALRRNVYRGFVASGRMKPEKAEHELACMEAVLATLQELEMGAANEPSQATSNREGRSERNARVRRTSGGFW